MTAAEGWGPPPGPAAAGAGAAPRPPGLIYPGPKDPRWAILLFLSCFVVYAISSPGFSRYPSQWAVSFLGCAVLDFAINYFWKGLLMVPMSGIVTSMGTLLLTDSPHVWPFFLVGALSTLSKHLIRAEGRHIFNPNNFGIVTAMLFFSNEVTVVAGRWGGSLSGMLAVAALGVYVARRAGRLGLAAAYALTFAVGAVVRAHLSASPIVPKIAPMTGASFMLFTFFMITDPMTTPPNARARIAFAVALAVIDSAMRHMEIHNSPFYALFILTGLLPLWRRYEWSEPSLWRWKLAGRPLGPAARAGPV